jgi:lipopolysaccharide transport system ATP-binding protein
MTEAAIEVRKLGKRYRIGGQQQAYGTLRDTLAAAAAKPLRRLRDPGDAGRRKPVRFKADQTGFGNELRDFWALREVSFDVKQGEVLGIIGSNGAGKSTLLKILSRVTYPTEGQADIYGRVGSLLEVGTGFHPELTGRENIYLNGAVLGMKRAEIQRRFDEIVEFAEIGQFLDTPVKRYSSGMYMRLAFAVAAHLEPEILIVDEVLAVGDAAFQKKCLGKMGEVAQEGRTVVFVSHNMAAIQALCNRVIWLDQGRATMDCEPGAVVTSYLQASSKVLNEQKWVDRDHAPGNEKVRLRRARVRPEYGSSSDPITIRTPIVLEFEYWNLQPGAYLNLSLHIYNQQGMIIFNAFPPEAPFHGRPYPVGLFRDVCHIPGDLLNDGAHRVELLVVQNDVNVIYRMDDILVFEVLDDTAHRGAWYGKVVGAVRPVLGWSTKLIEAEALVEERNGR